MSTRHPIRPTPRFSRRNVLGRLRRWAVRLSAVALLVIFSVLRIWDPVPVEALRLRTFDLFQIIQPRTQSINPVVIVDLDEDLKANPVGSRVGSQADVIVYTGDGFLLTLIGKFYIRMVSLFSYAY